MAVYPPQVMAQNIAAIRQEIRRAAVGAGRDPMGVLLCAASKMQLIETVRLVSKMDVDFFGENRAQELCEKYDAGAYGDKPVHFIGRLQSNKVKVVVGRAAVIESVDSLKLMEEIEKAAKKRALVQDIFIEVNISGEQSKGGVSPDDVYRLLEKAGQFPSLRVCGLLSVPPKAQSGGQNTPFFAILYKLFIDIKAKKYDNVCMNFLSMGMSTDFCEAVTEGSNIVRIGTAIFGARDY